MENCFTGVVVLLFCLLFFVLGFCGGQLTLRKDYLTECRKEHNVYSCELKAVPTDHKKDNDDGR